MKYNKSDFRAKSIQKARKELNITKLSEQERKDYQAYLESLSYQASMYESTDKLGKIEATTEAIKKLLLANILTTEQVAIIFDVPIEFILKIKNQLEIKT